jgi:hypothetical protein
VANPPISSSDVIGFSNCKALAECSFLSTCFEVDETSAYCVLRILTSNPSVERALSLDLHVGVTDTVGLALAFTPRVGELSNLTALRAEINAADVGTLVVLAQQLQGLRRLELIVDHSHLQV